MQPLMHIIFDFDGTLVDSSPGIVNCLSDAFQSCGFLPETEISSSMIGPPLREMIRLISPGIDDLDIETIAYSFRVRYDSYGFKLTEPFEGISDFLRELSTFGLSLYIATNKRKTPTDSILKHLGWNGFFKDVLSVDSIQPPFTNKSLMIQALLRDHSIHNRLCCYIGDRIDDYYAACEANVMYLMAGWGFAPCFQPDINSNKIDFLEMPSAAQSIHKLFEKSA